MRVAVKSVSIAAIALPVLLLAACSSNDDQGSASTSGTTIAVRATDSECIIDRSSIDSGPTGFTVNNEGSQVTEVYVYGRSGDAFTTVVSEVENIGPGVTRDMSADLAPGTYEVACKPGQTGDGIRTTLTVTGDAVASATSSAAAREISLGINDQDTLTGLAGQAAKVDEKIEFEVTNSSSGERVFEVKRPDGSVSGEIEIAAGASGDLIVDITVPGDWNLIVEGGANDTITDFPVS